MQNEASLFPFEELVAAYFECRRNKRNSRYALEFEFELERNLMNLYRELIEGTYQISRGICFVVEHPKIREVWAAGFRDRVVHHLIYNRLKTYFYPRFIRNSFACIPERGSLDAIQRLESGVRSITRNYSRPAYFLQFDIRNFFLSLNKDVLFELLEPGLDEPWLRRLTFQVLYHDPRQNCWMKSSREAFDRVPRYKSLWHAKSNTGLPIGNLTSQFFANVYLNELDQFVKHQLRMKYYYRYVDDAVILHESAQTLNRIYEEIDAFLRERLKLELHPYKKHLNRVELGINFVGFVVRPYRRYLRRRTINKLRSRIENWSRSRSGFDEDVLLNFRNSLNSYNGMLRNTKSWTIRKELARKVDCLFIRGDRDLTKFIVSGV